MKKRFLIPILGVFAFAIAFTFYTSSNTGDSPMFIDSDNIAHAKEISSHQECGYRETWLCVTDSSIEKDSEYCSGGGTITQEIQ
jgi:hypothetical protein